MVEPEMDATMEGVPSSKYAEIECLKGVLTKLLVWKTEKDFPLKCAVAVIDEVRPILDGVENKRDTLMLRAETGSGKNLAAVLLLAAAVMNHGMHALLMERAAFDETRTARTRNWIGWVKRVRRTSPLFSCFSVNHWSSIRSIIIVGAPDISETVVSCFKDHNDVMSISTLDDDDLSCDCCGVSWIKCRYQFYRCKDCDIDVCANCEDRRINFI